MPATIDRDVETRRLALQSDLPPSDDEDEVGLELVTDETIELLLRGAKALVMVVNVVVLITFGILTLGFFLHLAGASPEASFVEWVYRNTNRAMEPFRGMFPVREIDDRSVFDASLLFAAAAYGFMAIGLHALIVYLSAKVRRYHRRAIRTAAATTAGAQSPNRPEPEPNLGGRPAGREFSDRTEAPTR